MTKINHIKTSKLILNNKGFTIIEMIISLVIFLSVIGAGTNILIISSKTTSRILTNNELFESAKTSMDFIEMQVRNANSIKLRTKKDNTLVTLQVGDTGNLIFKFDKDALENNIHYQRLEFGDQELKQYIKDIKMYIDASRNILNVEITTSDRISKNGTISNPAVLSKEINIEYKVIK